MKRAAADSFEDQCSRIFVGSLSFSTTWQALKDHFKVAGEVTYASVLMTPGGQSKGCGMVDFRSAQEAAWAVELLNGSELDGRNIVVKVDVDGKRRQVELRQSGHHAPQGQPTRAAQAISNEPYHKLQPEQIKRVFVGNLSYETNWQALKDHFGQIGEVEIASVLLAPDRTSKGCGMVDYRTHEEAMRAAEMLNNSELDNRNITVKLDVDGKFKSRPAPGARRPVYQVKKPQQLALGNAPGGSGGGSSSAQPSPMQALTALNQYASMPGARDLDWPSLVKQLTQGATAGKNWL